jgi:hypothetical protein
VTPAQLKELSAGVTFLYALLYSQLKALGYRWASVGRSFFDHRYNRCGVASRLRSSPARVLHGR